MRPIITGTLSALGMVLLIQGIHKDEWWLIMAGGLIYGATWTFESIARGRN